jgi:hypothetical protein
MGDPMNAILDAMRQEFASMRTEMTTMRTEMTTAMSGEVQKITSRLDDMNGRLVKIEDNQSKLLKNLPIFEKAGDTFELIARQELRKHKGEYYARSFMVRDLAGLHRLSAPKNFHYTRGVLSGAASNGLQLARTKSLAEHALKASYF